MTNNENKLPADKLERVLANLKITLSKSEDGSSYTVYSTSEPLFCFVRSTEKELEDLVSKTIESYIVEFYNVGDVTVTTSEVPLEVISVSIERSRPIGRFVPTISSPLIRGRGLVHA